MDIGTCPHVWRVDDWTFRPDVGVWVHADPECMLPSPFAAREGAPKARRRVIRNPLPETPTQRPRRRLR